MSDVELRIGDVPPGASDAVLNALPLPVIMVAADGKIADANVAAETFFEVSVPLADLPEESRAWERGVDELSREDTEVAEYVRALEESRDAADLPEASGEAIAKEFERYLKRRHQGGQAEQ